MKTYHFYHKNPKSTITVDGATFQDAEKELALLVKTPENWRCLKRTNE